MFTDGVYTSDESPACAYCLPERVAATNAVMARTDPETGQEEPVFVCAAHLDERVDAGDPELPFEVAADFARQAVREAAVSEVMDEVEEPGMGVYANEPDKLWQRPGKLVRS